MNSSTKITLKSQTGRGSKYSLQKLNLIYQIGLKLALINGYDEKFRIRNKKGEYIPNSNLLDLIHNSMIASKNLAGMEEFIELLAEANAEPEWFVNDIVKSSLKNLIASKTRDISRETSPPRDPSPEPLKELSNESPPVINPITTGAYWGPEKVNEKKNRVLATYRKPPLPPMPPLKRAPISYTPPYSPPSPYKKERFSFPSKPPTIDRMDVPPASPPGQMPSLKRMRPADDEEDDMSARVKKTKTNDFRDLVNKSMQWDLPDEDEEFN